MVPVAFESFEIPAGALVKGDSIRTVHGWATVTNVRHLPTSVVITLLFRWGGYEHDFSYNRSDIVRVKKR